MRTTQGEWSFRLYHDLLRLRAFGCPVEYPSPTQTSQGLRLASKPTYLQTNIYSISQGAAVVFWLDIRTASALNIYKCKFASPWLKGPLSLLTPADKDDRYYCLPPIWIRRQQVLNEALCGGRGLRRDGHWAGFVLGILDHPVSPTAGENIEAVFSIEDLRGFDHTLPLTLINRPLNPELLRQMGEEATFPPPAEEPPAATAEPEAAGDKTTSSAWEI